MMLVPDAVVTQLELKASVPRLTSHDENAVAGPVTVTSICVPMSPSITSTLVSMAPRAEVSVSASSPTETRSAAGLVGDGRDGRIVAPQVTVAWMAPFSPVIVSGPAPITLPASRRASPSPRSTELGERTCTMPRFTTSRSPDQGIQNGPSTTAESSSSSPLFSSVAIRCGMVLPYGPSQVDGSVSSCNVPSTTTASTESFMQRATVMRLVDCIVRLSATSTEPTPGVCWNVTCAPLLR